MIIDTISIIACVLIVLLTIESIIANPFFRNIRRRDDDDFSVADAESIDELPKLSVIVLANNNFEALDAHLPLLLTQDYAPGYEVIVVGEKATSTPRTCFSNMPTTSISTPPTFPTARSS